MRRSLTVNEVATAIGPFTKFILRPLKSTRGPAQAQLIPISFVRLGLLRASCPIFGEVCGQDSVLNRSLQIIVARTRIQIKEYDFESSFHILDYSLSDSRVDNFDEIQNHLSQAICVYRYRKSEMITTLRKCSCVSKC